MRCVDSFSRLRSYCEAEGYKGWDPYDGLNSRVFQALPLLKKSALCRLVMIQGFKRSPVNFRRMALVHEMIDDHQTELVRKLSEDGRRPWVRRGGNFGHLSHRPVILNPQSRTS